MSYSADRLGADCTLSFIRSPAVCAAYRYPLIQVPSSFLSGEVTNCGFAEVGSAHST